MLDVLAYVEEALPSIHADLQWQPFVEKTPAVERRFADWNNSGILTGHLRIHLHRITPDGNAFMHPHPWPLASSILGPGTYEMGIGAGPTWKNRVGHLDYEAEAPAVAFWTQLTAPARYAMVDPSLWHFVRAINAPLYTLAVTIHSTDSWGLARRDRTDPLPKMSSAKARALLDLVRRKFGDREQNELRRSITG